MKRTIARLTAIGALSLAALGIVPVAASAGAAASVQLSKNATLQADGTVLVSLSYRCNPAADSSTGGQLQVELAQEEPPILGLGLGTPTCDGSKHKATVDVAGPGRFSVGSATAFALVRNSDFTSEAEENAVLKVK